MLLRLCCQTSYERVCFRSGYRTLTNKEPCTYEGNGARRTLPKINRLMMVFRCWALRRWLRVAIPAPPSNPDQAPHCRWTQSHGCATWCTIGAMLSSSPECYKACTFNPSLIQTNRLHNLSSDVFSTACCPAGIGSVGHPRCCVI